MNEIPSLENLIQKIYAFTIVNENIKISNETHEAITINIKGSSSVLLSLKELYISLYEFSNEEGFITDNNSNNIDLEEINSNIDTGYEDFEWILSLNKLRWFKIKELNIIAFFNHDFFISSLANIDPFDKNSFFIQDNHFNLILPFYKGNDIEEKNFTISSKIRKKFFHKNYLEFPSDERIKEHTLVNTQKEIIFKPNNFMITTKEENEFLKLIRIKYSIVLTSMLVHTFYSEKKVVLKGLKHLSLNLYDNSFSEINQKPLKLLEEITFWIYEENINTRKQLFLDRLSFHENKEKSLINLVLTNMKEAFEEAKERYKFVISEKSDEFTKDLRDLLKDTKEKADKYSEKTRNVISSLLRDVLGSIFFLGLTVYARFSNNQDFLSSENAHLIFILLGIYFLLSMLTQAFFNIWDIYLTIKESKDWTKNTMDYITKESYKKYVTNPLERRTMQFTIIQFIVIIIYCVLSYLSFNAIDIIYWL